MYSGTTNLQIEIGGQPTQIPIESYNWYIVEIAWHGLYNSSTYFAAISMDEKSGVTEIHPIFDMCAQYMNRSDFVVGSYESILILYLYLVVPKS